MPKYRTVEKRDDVRTAKRVYLIGAVFACAFGILASRAVAFHLKDNAKLEQVALRQYRTAVHQSTQRGKILDAAGRELAIDNTAQSVWANPREVDDPVVMAERLSSLLGVDRRKLLDRLSSGRKFIWVKRRLSDAEATALKEQELTGVYLMRESKRFYPGGTLASAILGAVGFDAEPLGGVELSYDDQLSTRKRSGEMRRDARGHLYLSPSDDGEEGRVAHIELTIDRTLQFIAERELERAVTRSRAKGGTAVVVDVNTGAVLAIANRPTFDPNEYERSSLEHWRNRAIVDAYEPGSTFKTIVVAAALDRGVVTREDVINCEGGNLRIGSNIVHDAHPHGKLSVADIVKVSSNIGAYKVEKRLGRERSYEAIRAFGFGTQTGIDLPGESTGLLSPSERWSELQFATIAFGQGISVTPLQMAMAFAAIANGGTLYQPYVVKRVVRDDGQELLVQIPRARGRPIQPEAAKVMSLLLERVVEKGGTGSLAASFEYRVAGKTGTAQKTNVRRGGYAAGRYYSSFIGFAPADEPRIAVYVGIDEPGGRMYYGGQVAAPAFREIVEATLHYLKVPGKLTVASNEVELQLPPKAETAELAVIERPGQAPPAIVPAEEGMWRLPDLRGLTMRRVLAMAGGVGLSWRFEGTGVAVRQSCEPGSVVDVNTECTVEFAPLM